MISNCGSDERGLYAGGAAGDQTGGEWKVMPWYSRPWDCVLRHPSEAVRKKISELAKAAAANNHIGYDQGTVGNTEDRYSFWIRLRECGYNPASITEKCETDCSAGVAAIVKATGYLLGMASLKKVSIYLYTGNMRLALSEAGFDVLTDPKYLVSDDYLLEGDILLNERYHVATNLDNGAKAAPEAGAGAGTGTSNAGSALNTEPRWTGTVSADALKVRTWAGTENRTCSFSPLYHGEAVEVCDSVRAGTGEDWYYIRKKINGTYKYGFVSSAYIIGRAEDTKGTASTTGNEETIYKFLTGKLGLNAAAACGVLANLQAESGMQSAICETLCLTRLKENGKTYTSATYTAAVDSGKISRAEFLSPLPGKQYGYGLVQWTSPGRKAGLYDMAKQKGVSIGDMNMQLEYLAMELAQNYTSVLEYIKDVPNTAQGAYDAAYKWCEKYEIPADTLATAARRGSLARTYWPKYK